LAEPLSPAVSPKEGGYTAVEIIVVLVIASVLSSMAFPVIESVVTDVRLDVAAERLGSDLYWARIQAVKRNDVVHVATTGPGSYEIQSVGARRLAAKVEFGPATTDTLRFAPFGLTVSGPATYVLTLGSASRTLDVSPAGLPEVR